jgi:hypothetical protein
MKKYSFQPVNKRISHLITLLLLALSSFLIVSNSTRETANHNIGKASISRSGNELFQFAEGNLLTIAAIHASVDGRNMIINFFERESNYFIGKEDKLYVQNREILAQAFKNNIPVRVFVDPKTNAIVNILKATDAEIRAYNTGDGMNSPERKIKGDPNALIDLSKIDTSIFNKLEYQVRWFPGLKLCNNVVPDYATLVSIFNYCASQGCNKPGPYSITNCIPFQYVRDGCFARAHKMRQMILKKYGYCVEKVFSYGPYPATLAVKATMWGGCCVDWWYHVVPLLRINYLVKGQVFQLCYVIDPGMFIKPVPLSTWLNAQKNTTCFANAAVTSYSIQQGSAYYPMNGGASYATDPNYIDTEQTLIGYKNGVTCP